MTAPARPFPFAMIGFDLDGTLLDTLGDLAAALNHVLVGAGRPALELAVVRRLIGGGSRQMLARALDATGGDDPALADRLYPDFLERYGAHIADATTPYPGMVAALDALAAHGVRLAIVTNKPHALAVRLVEAMGLAPRFDLVLGGDTLGPGRAKPAPDPILAMIAALGGGRAAFVGDSVFDAQAARAAGVPAVLVGFGYSDRPVATLGADAVIDDYAALLPALVRLGSAG